MTRFWLVCAATLAMSGCSGSNGDSSDPIGGNPPLADTSYQINGTLDGLTTPPVVLQLNGSETLSLSDTGNFSFTGTVAANANWSVTVASQPVGQSCTVAPASGTATADVSITVTCTDNTYQVLGSASGLLANPVTLQLNGTETLNLTGNGSFGFTSTLAYNASWQVAVQRQPLGRHCTVTPENGVATADVQLSVTCSEPAIVKLRGSFGSSCALLNDGTVRCWGAGLDADHRGDQPDEMGDALPPIDFGGTPPVQIATGLGPHSCALFANGTVKCWGQNRVGQLGQGDTRIRGDDPGDLATLPAISLGAGRAATQVAVGRVHSCALLDNGQVKCWGDNTYGQLGLGHTNATGDQAGEMGDTLPPVDLGTNRYAVTIAAGYSHTCAVLDDASLKCWGRNAQGQLGLGDVLTRGDEPGEMGDALPVVNLGSGQRVLDIQAGTHTCALLDGNGIKCWGWNGYGQLGLGHTNTIGDGPGEMGDALPFVYLGTDLSAVSLSVGMSTACAVLNNGSAKCWGFNFSGQLGLGDTTSRGDAPGEMGDNLPPIDLGTGTSVTAMSVGQDHVCAILGNAAVKCWGAGNAGGLGLGDALSRGDGPGEMGYALPAVAMGADRSARQIATGANVTCTLLDDGSAKCWGSSSWEGQLGNGEPGHRGDEPDEMTNIPPAYLGGDLRAVDLATGDTSVCVLREDGRVVCWGNNYNGQLGQGDTLNRRMPVDAKGEIPPLELGTGRTVVALDGADNHYCALLDDNSLKCWGDNYLGQLGLGHSLNQGDGPGEMGDSLPAVDVGGTVASFSVGADFTCALLIDGATKCWGNNGAGQLGLGDANNRGDDPNEMGANLPPIDLGSGRAAVNMSAGCGHVCALLDDTSLKCWGWNWYGQLGLGDAQNRGDGIAEMGDQLPPIDPGTGRTVREVSTGYSHSCALLDDGSVKCWGGNFYGQLGLGDTTDRGQSPGSMGDTLLAVDLGTGRTAVALHRLTGDHTCASLDDGSVKCWGDNGFGQLGRGNTSNLGDEPNEMGDNLPALNLW